MKRFLGCHVSAAGGLHNGLSAGKQLGINTIQIHPSPPQRWNSKAYQAGIEDDFLNNRFGSGIERIFFHAIYLINLATPNKQHWQLSKLSLMHYLDLSARIKGDGVIVHVGSMKDEPDEKVGYARAAEAINSILEESPETSRLLLEVAAGAGMVIGDRMEDLKEIYDQVENKERLGFALDTQHMWASGYNWRDDLEKIVKEIDSIFGIDKVWAIHLNDSKTELASRKDRHENLGDGLIGIDALIKIVNHKKFLDIPFILETPDLKTEEGAQRETRKLLELAGQLCT